MSDVLANALDVVRDALEQRLQAIEPRSEAWICLGNVLNADGSANPEASDRIVMAVHGILRETAIAYQPNSSDGNGYAVVSPPLHLDVRLVFCANFSGTKYRDGLALLGRVMAFFQQSPIMTHQNTPSLDRSIDKLAFEFENLDPAELAHAMATLGTRYLPSAFYRMRGLSISSEMR